jgi:thymidylate synthase (FAD)
MVLPLNAMTNFYWTGSLMAFARVIQQRSDSHAQLIANEFAQQLQDVVQSVYPESFKALLTATKGE